MRSKLGPVALAALFVACGGATQSDLFSSGGGSANDANGTDGGASSGDSGSITQHDAGGSGESDATTANDSGTSNDGGVIVVDAGHDSGIVIDAGPVDPGIFCGKDQGQTVYCKVGVQTCCATNQGQGTTQLKCGLPNQCNSGSAASITCDDTTDCPGQVCCGVFDGQRYTKVACTTAAACDGTGPNGETLYRICDPFLNPSDCPQGTTCQASAVLTGYYLCR
jgi:hypothetical protein